MEAVPVADVVDERNQPIGDVALAAQSAAMTMLITAGCGAAVEQLARHIHAASARATSPFVQVAAATFSSDAAVLTKTCADLLETAGGGSLLLADVEQMPTFVQLRLIETLAELQAAVDRISRVRLIAGTTTILYERVSGGTFSAQLFYRLNIVQVVGTHDVRAAGAALGGA
jgi:DNA-binding NtrC family response regulator